MAQQLVDVRESSRNSLVTGTERGAARCVSSCSSKSTDTSSSDGGGVRSLNPSRSQSLERVADGGALANKIAAIEEVSNERDYLPSESTSSSTPRPEDPPPLNSSIDQI